MQLDHLQGFHALLQQAGKSAHNRTRAKACSTEAGASKLLRISTHPLMISRLKATF